MVGSKAVSLTSIVLVAAPPLLAFSLVGGFVAAETLGLRPLSAQAANLSEAAAVGAAAAALRFIASGSDPNIARPIASGVLGVIPRTVNAIDAAILGRRPEMIELLRQHGARVGDIDRSRCLAEAVQLPEALPLLGITAANPRPEPPGDADDLIEACLQMSKTSSW